MLKRLSQRLTSFHPKRERSVWFYRDYGGFTGGHLKHAHYYQNVQALNRFRARMVFSRDSLSEEQCSARGRLWPQASSASVDWSPAQGDILFLAGLDWRFLLSSDGVGLELPKINLIQHVRHADSQTELYDFLTEKAIRICVSQEVADAITATKKVNGPVITIPNGIDVPKIKKTDIERRYNNPSGSQKVLIVGYKMPALATTLSNDLKRLGVEHLLVNQLLERETFLSLLKEYDVVVCYPNITEGFYLPALEVMAAGAVLVVPDCVGNRGFCMPGETCFMPGYSPSEMLNSVLGALSLTVSQRKALLRRALKKVSQHSLNKEKKAFYSVLNNVDQLW